MNQFFNHLIEEFHLPLHNPVLIFSLILFIILLSPILLKRLNIPGIIGLIISGLVIGPHGFGILDNNSAIRLFSTIGLLYIMFIAGLELDMNQFKANKNKSLLFGFFTFIIPLSIGYPVCFYILNYDFNASFLTASMFATHTLVAYPIVSKMGVSKNQAVAVAVGGTILTDTAVLIILAVIMGNSQGSLNQEFWIRLGVSLALFSAIMFFIIPRIAKWFFRKLESEKHAHYIFVLAVVFFAAFLAEMAGVEPIIGAFVAGLALNKLIPHSSALMNRIEFIGNSLFIPFFLISVGMLVDISVLLNGPMALIVAATLTIVALLGKWLAALFTQLVFKYTNAQRQLIFGLSSSHAAATLAVILVGYRAKILDENILNGTIILILITCIIASFATEKAAKKILVTESDDDIISQNNHTQSHEQILIPIADASYIEKLLEFALLIKDKKSTNPISILSVVPNDEEAEINIIKARHKLDEYVKQASATEIKTNIITTIDHNTASGIGRASREIMSDMVIIGWSRKSGIVDKILGDNSDGIINAVHKNLFVCDFNNSLVIHQRVVVISPPFAELEKGFELWLKKVIKLAEELSLPIIYFGEIKTKDAILSYIKKKSINAVIQFHSFNDWEDFLILSRDITNRDLIFLISARLGSISHINILESIPSKLERYFNNNSKIIIYPQHYNLNPFEDNYGDVSSRPLTKGIEVMEQLGKGIGSIFKKGN